MRKITILLVVQVSLFNILTAKAETLYNVIGLGDGIPYSVNDHGQIVGVFNGYATLFDSNGGGNKAVLGTLPQGGPSEAHCININGKIVGWANNSLGVARATLFDISGQGNNLELGRTLAANSPSWAYSINDVNQIVGAVQTQGWWPAIFDIEGNTFQNLSKKGKAFSVQDNGQIVGWVRIEISGGYYYNAGINNTGTDLGGLGYPGSAAWSNNESGQIVGQAQIDASRNRAVLFDSTGSKQNVNLKTLGGTDSVAYSINDIGQIVGWSYNAAGLQRATLFDASGNGNNIDLNTVIEQTSGWVLNVAYSINNNGWIVGSGSNGAFLLKPLGNCTQRPQMDFNGDCKVDFRDFAIFTQSWLDCNLDPLSACWE